jgi:MFS family permease
MTFVHCTHFHLYMCMIQISRSVAIPSFLTLLVPLASRYSFEMAVLLRVLIGFFESASFPAVFYFFPIWIPTAEKTRIIPFIISGIYMGEVIGFSLSGILADSQSYFGDADIFGGWPAVFYVFGSAGLLWYPLWMHCSSESPSTHPTITKEELAFIKEGSCRTVYRYLDV